MPGAYTFKCPACGASLTPQGDAVQITCEYCGQKVVVPEELRPKPAGRASGPLVIIERGPSAETVLPRERQKSNPLFSILSAIMVIAGIGVCMGLAALADPATQQSIAGLIAPTKTPLPISRVLSANLPRQVRYAGLVLSLQRAEISNHDPAATDPARQYRSDQGYATLELSISNAVASKSVTLDSGVARLQLGDGKQYKPSSGWRNSYDPQSTVQTRLVFNVPINATWSGAQLILNQPNKEPATLALDGAVIAAPTPIAFKGVGAATAAEVNYQVTLASLDLDWNGERADLGKRFLIFSIHITNKSTFAGGVAIIPNDFRLIVDGDAQAPLDAPIEVLNATSSMDAQVVFSIPARVGKTELQVGEVGHATATIPVATGAQ